MHKMQFTNTNYDLLAKFLMQKNRASIFFNFLTLYDVQTYTGNNPFGVIGLMTWICLKMAPGL